MPVLIMLSSNDSNPNKLNAQVDVVDVGGASMDDLEVLATVLVGVKLLSRQFTILTAEQEVEADKQIRDELAVVIKTIKEAPIQRVLRSRRN